MAVSRRVILGQAAALAVGLAGGSGAEELLGASAAPGLPPGYASTISPQVARGTLPVWWSASITDRRVALTFDDGPTEQFTGQLLDLLARRHVTATFFVIGALAERHPDLIRRTRDEGHELANHSYDHVSAAKSDGPAVHASVTRGAEVLHQLTGQSPRWFRPPRGEVTSATLLASHANAQQVALWSVARDAGNLADGDSTGVGRHLLEAVHPGAIVDLHDGIGRSSFSGTPDRSLLTRRRAELGALPAVLDGWQRAGYRFARLSELIPG
jgi:peptidoglycan-N-acetylglucosamine deacetylase